MTDHSNLKAKAEAATAGEWYIKQASKPIDDAYDFAISADNAPVLAEAFGRSAKGDYLPAEANAAYIAAANPKTVLALIAEIDQLQSELTALRAQVEDLSKKCQMTIGVGDGLGQLFVHGDYDSIKAVQRIILGKADSEKAAFNEGVEAAKDVVKRAELYYENQAKAAIPDKQREYEFAEEACLFIGCTLSTITRPTKHTEPKDGSR